MTSAAASFIDVRKVATINVAFDSFESNFSRTVHGRITKLYSLIGDSQRLNLPAMTSSLAASGRLLNEKKCKTKVRKTGATGRVE